MRTNIVLDDRLVAEAMRATGARSKPEVVAKALRELLAKHRARRVIALSGQALIDPRYDVRVIRRTMRRDAR